MLKNIINKILSVKPVYLIVFYVTLQAFLYFQPFLHGTGASFYYLEVDKELFSRDIIKTSTLGTSTMFYPFMHFFLGGNLTNPYYLFLPYLAVCLLIALSIYLIGIAVSKNRPEAGVLMLVLLLVQKMPIQGAYVSLISADFNYQHFTLPIVLFSIYFLIRERFFIFSFLLALSFYFHLKTPFAIALAVTPLIIYKIWKDPRILKQFIIPFMVLIPRIWMMFNQLYGKSGFSPDEKAQYMALVLQREQIEGSMYFDISGVTNLIVYLFIASIGITTARLISDKELRKSVYLCHAGVFFAFFAGIIVRLIDGFITPLGEVIVAGYSRASVLGLVLTLATVSIFLVRRIELSINSKRYISIALLVASLLFIGANDFYYENIADLITVLTGKKAILKLCFSIVAAFLSIAAIKISKNMISIKNFMVMLLIFVIGYTGIKGVAMVRNSYAMDFPYTPFVAQSNFFDRDLYESGIWIRKNTDKNDLFITVLGNGDKENDFCRGGLRNTIMRSSWCQGLISSYGNAEAYREWKRRRYLLRKYLGIPFYNWDMLFEQEKIDYILSAKNSIKWPENCEKIYENDSYIIYKIN